MRLALSVLVDFELALPAEVHWPPDVDKLFLPEYQELARRFNDIAFTVTEGNQTIAQIPGPACRLVSSRRVKP